MGDAFTDRGSQDVEKKKICVKKKIWNSFSFKATEMLLLLNWDRSQYKKSDTYNVQNLSKVAHTAEIGYGPLVTHSTLSLWWSSLCNVKIEELYLYFPSIQNLTIMNTVRAWKKTKTR